MQTNFNCGPQYQIFRTNTVNFDGLTNMFRAENCSLLARDTDRTDRSITATIDQPTRGGGVHQNVYVKVSDPEPDTGEAEKTLAKVGISLSPRLESDRTASFEMRTRKNNHGRKGEFNTLTETIVESWKKALALPPKKKQKRANSEDKKISINGLIMTAEGQALAGLGEAVKSYEILAPDHRSQSIKLNSPCGSESEKITIALHDKTSATQGKLRVKRGNYGAHDYNYKLTNKRDKHRLTSWVRYLASRA